MLTLIVIWALFDIGCRGIAWLLGGEAFTLFTPSRFITDAVPLMAVFSGIFLAHLCRHRLAWILCVILLLSIPTFLRCRELAQDVGFDRRYIQAAAWIRENAPRDVLVNNGQTHPTALRWWLTYLTRRPTTYTHMPTSEPYALMPERKTGQYLLEIRPAKWQIEQAGPPVFATGTSPLDIVIQKFPLGPATTPTSQPSP